MRNALLSLLLLLLPSLAQAADEFGKLTPEEVKAQIGQKGVYVFDNNDPSVFKEAHLPTAKWLDPGNYDPKSLPADKRAILIFYCHNEH